MGRAVFEREAEMAALETTVQRAARGNGAAVLVEGVAGIGKSALLAEMVSIAQDQGFALFEARATTLESTYAYGVLRQLLDSPLRGMDPAKRAELLSGPAALAGPAIGVGLGDPHPRALDVFTVGHGLWWLIEAMSREAPMLLVLDDAQWSDDASLTALSYVVRRIRELPAVVALGWRTGEAEHAEVLDTLYGEPELVRLRPAALTPRGSARLVTALRPDLTDDIAEACHSAAGGNPFLTRELVRALPKNADVGNIAALTPESVRRDVSTRLARLPEAARRMAKAVAVLDVDAGVHSATVVAALDPAESLPAVDALVAAGLLASKIPLEFAHPLLRVAVYDSIGLGERSVLHRRAADVLATGGDGSDRAATHLLLVEPMGDMQIAAHLRQAATRAMVAGAPATAAVLLRRARRESASDTNPELLADLGHAELAAGDREAVRTLSQSLEQLTDPGLRARTAADLALALGSAERVTEAVSILDREAARLSPSHPELAHELLSLLALGLDDPAMATTIRKRAGELVTAGVPQTPAGRRLIITAAYARALVTDGPAEEVMRLLAPAIQDDTWWHEHPLVSFTAAYGALATLIWTGHVGTAGRTASAALREAEQSGERFAISALAFWVSHVALLTGDLPAAEASAARSTEEAGQSTFMRIISRGVLVQALVARGRLEEADSVLGSQDLLFGDLPGTVPGSWLRYARCELHLARGRHAEAARDAKALSEYSARTGGSPPGWGRPVIAAMRRSGERDLATFTAELLLERAQAWNEPGSLGIALCNAGRVHDRDRALELLAAGVEVLASTPLRLELARGHIDYGDELARAGRRDDARRSYDRGLDLAHLCGARPLEQLAAQGLRATGARPRRLARSGVDALTPGEYRVVELAAAGMSNAQVCQALYLTRSTVEKHLSSAYRKLGVTSREQLPETLIPGQ